jgi:anti-sigma regulatory factor (Ser/Thr protein kinase)
VDPYSVHRENPLESSLKTLHKKNPQSQLLQLTDDNVLAIVGPLGMGEYCRVLAAIHDRVSESQCEKIKLDFSRCDAAFAGPMLALCAQVGTLRNKGTECELVLPQAEILSKLFVNANWAYLLDPNHHRPSRFRGSSQVPAIHFLSADDQSAAVTQIINTLLSSLSGLSRTDLAAIEWSLNEITDNVINHSESSTGGYVQLSTFKSKSIVEFVVSDAGIGIPTSLRRPFPELTSDTDALDRAIREGVTRDKQVGQGNGLFGSFGICWASEGYFEIDSGYGRLNVSKQRRMRIREDRTPYKGTLVVAGIDYSKPNALKEALRFGDKVYTPVDYIETHYESRDGQRIVFVMEKEASSFGSRAAAKPVKTKLESLVTMCPEKKVFIDFGNIPVISSSFADEVLGKLFLELGPVVFTQKFEIVNTSETVQSLINLAIKKRLASA